MPYPNEHSCRLKLPEKYDRFARKNDEINVDGKSVDIIYGIKAGKSEIQAMRFSIDIWNENDAKKYCDEKGGFFEPAKKEMEDEMDFKEYVINGLKVSDASWANIDKTKLPFGCFLFVPDEEKKSTWKLPYKEGSGDVNSETGMYGKAGVINLAGIKAAWAAMNGARTGKKMDLPALVWKKAKDLMEKIFGKEYKQEFQEKFGIKNVAIFATGVWNGEKFEIKDLDRMIKNTNELIERKLITSKMKLGHIEGDLEKEVEVKFQKLNDEGALPVFGKITNFKRIGSTMFADFSDIPKEVYGMIENGMYNDRSIEVYPIIKIDSEKFIDVITAVVLLGSAQPAVKGLGGIFDMALQMDENAKVKWYNFKMEDVMDFEKLYKDLLIANKALEQKFEETKKFSDKITNLETEKDKIAKQLKSIEEKNVILEKKQKELLDKFKADMVESLVKVGVISSEEKDKMIEMFKDMNEAQIRSFAEIKFQNKIDFKEKIPAGDLTDEKTDVVDLLSKKDFSQNDADKVVATLFKEQK